MTERVFPAVPSYDLDPLLALLGMVRTRVATTRPDLVRLSGFGRTVVAQRVAQLLEMGLLEDDSFAPSTGGRAARGLRFRAEAGQILAVELGATSVRVGVADLSGALLTTYEESADIADGPDKILSHVEGMLDKQLASLGARASATWGIGIGIPGPVEFATGRPVAPPIMPGWDRYPVRRRLTKRFGAPTWVDNEVNLMALGELRVGLARGVRDLLFVKVGTGIGAGLVSGGRLHRGAQGSAGDVGHVAISDDPSVVCRCGNTGCLEAVAGGAALAAEANRAARSGVSPYLASLLAERDNLDARDLAAAAERGDPLAMNAFVRSGHLVGSMLATCVNLYNPALVILGGGVSRAGDHFLAAIREVVYSRSLPLATRELRIVRSALEAEAGLHGAAYVVVDELFSTELFPLWSEAGSTAGRADLLELRD